MRSEPVPQPQGSDLILEVDKHILSLPQRGIYLIVIWFVLITCNFHIDEMPTLNQLQLLKGRGQEVRVIERIAPRWKQIAAAIGFDGSRILSIEQNSHFQTEDACLNMFIRWQSGEHGLKPCKWTSLIECCKDIKERSLEKSLLSLCLRKEQVGEIYSPLVQFK